MDEQSKILWQEVMDYLELDRLLEEKKPIEAEAKPPIRKNVFQSVIEEKERSILSELQRYCKTQVLAGLKDSARVISDETPEGPQVILDFVEKQFLNGQAKMSSLREELASLKEWGKYLDEEFNRAALALWNDRFRSIDHLVAEVTARIPEKFNPTLINSERYPYNRVTEVSEGVYADKWLAAQLGLKGAIPFEPHSKYLIELKRWGKEIGLPMLQREQDEQRRARMA